MKRSIWVLFSIENNYDQPNNNMVCWWVDKPHFLDIQKVLGGATEKEVGDIIRGSNVRVNYRDSDIRLEEVVENTVLED